MNFEKKKILENKYLFFFIFFLGSIFRIYFFKNSGTIDLSFYSNYLTVLKNYENLSYLYFPGFQNITNWKEYNLPLMYPPGFLYILYIISKLYFINEYFDPQDLIKISIIFFELALLLYFLLNYKSKKFFFLVFFWLNPMILITGSALGYVDSIFIFFVILSLVLIKKNHLLLSAIFFIAACSIKQLALILLPIIFIYFLKINNFKKNLFYLVLIFLLIISFLIPIILSSINFNYQDTFIGLLRNMYWLVNHNYISANGLNIWWIYSGYNELVSLFSQNYSMKDIIENLNITYLKSSSPWGHESLISKILILIFVLVNLIIVFKLKEYTDFLKLLFFQYFSYIALATGTHENHAVLLSYLSILVYFFDKNFKVPCLIINSYTFLNIWMFYGFNGQNILRDSFIWQLTTLMLSFFIAVYFFYMYMSFYKKLKLFD